MAEVDFVTFSWIRNCNLQACLISKMAVGHSFDCEY